MKTPKIYDMVTVLGPTASGKTKLAVRIAELVCGEIISADSRQVYTGMNLGTGKDYVDYEINGKIISSHLIDIVSPLEEYNLFRFKKDFFNAYNKIIRNKNIPVMCGGTGMYLSCVLQNYNLVSKSSLLAETRELQNLTDNELIERLVKLRPKLHNQTDIVDRERIIEALEIELSKFHFEAVRANSFDLNIESLIFGTLIDRDLLKTKIRDRLKERLNSGMIEEAEYLLTIGITHEKLRFFGLEYKFLSMYLNKELNYNDMFQKLHSAICDFAKRQMTWYRKMEREGVKINWLEPEDFERAKRILFEFGLGVA